jgi:DNA-directed RNA polymerase specialized sigma24 family protein
VEIAEALEVAVGTVKSRLSYGLAALRRVLTEKAQ